MNKFSFIKTLTLCTTTFIGKLKILINQVFPPPILRYGCFVSKIGPGDPRQIKTFVNNYY